MHAENDKKHNGALIGNAIRSIFQMILLVDAETLQVDVVDQNPELEHLTVTGSLEDFCRDLYVNLHPVDREGFTRFTDPGRLSEELRKRVFLSHECRIRRANGHYYWSEILFCHATEEDSVSGQDYLFLIRDIHDRKMQELQEEAEQQAFLKETLDRFNNLFEENMKDEQTGCYNRKGMRYYTARILEEARKEQKHLFVCVADLNGLKHLNDTYGHAAGDEAIAAVSAELLKAAPQGSRIVRTGGDEFMIMSALSPDCEEPEQMGEKLDRGLAAYNAARSNPYTVGASYGWVFLPVKEGMTDLDEYIDMADARMYEMRAKRDEYRRS
ncbi:MAG: sensor domain-containing diguanylate cyclase [Lachnospiraceae bacterium]|nr:sensor domain-containing diguanylate cyclase [Lachnospiraceae bacterium]